MTKNKIALNVLAEVTKKANIQKNLDSKYIGLIVFTGSDVKLIEKIEKLKQLKEKKLKFSLAFSFMASKILDLDYITYELEPVEIYKEEDIFKIEDIVNKHSYIIGVNLTINTLSKVALGIIDGFIPSLIWTYLYKGKKTYLDYYSIRNYMGEPSNNNALSNIIKGYLDILKSMGAIEIELESYDKLLIPSLEHIKDGTEKLSFSLGKVVTENDIRGLPKGETIVLSKGTIITPLAKDTAKLMGIILKEEN